MPELVESGPIIPVRLMSELESGKVVFFCGAGISMGPASNLPSFSGLVKYVYKANHYEPDDSEREALDLDDNESIDDLDKEQNGRRRPLIDKALDLLERPDRLGPATLRRSVIECLGEPAKSPLVTHEALIKLSRTTTGVRLLTTNFDNRFAEAGLEDNLIYDAPISYVPQPHNWSSLVHLHGRILPSNGGSNLVLTATDFGRAYLTERWAARFIIELFREFTVVFVGYSLGDPFMSYIVNALAAERAEDVRLNIAYAFAAHDGSDSNKQRVGRDWLASKVEPILYDKKDDHKLLQDTLVKWARIKADPYSARKEIVLKGISKLPVGPDDPVVGSVTWALEESVAAEALVEYSPIIDEKEFPKLERWLDMFAKAGLLSRPKKTEDRSETDQDDLSVSLVGSDAQTRNPPELGVVTRYLAHWMARHLHVPQVLGWVLKKGGHLHPFLRDQVRSKLAEPVVEIPEQLRRLWTVLADDTPIDLHKLFLTSFQIKKATSEFERHRLEEHIIKSIAPRLVVRSGPSLHLSWKRASRKKPRPIPPIDACGHLELLVCDRDESHEIQQILNDAGALARNAETLTGYLEHALTLLADIGNTYSGFYRPSIADHDQNRLHDDRTLLIDLIRDSYFALVATRSGRARARNLLERWVLSKQPLFNRLALHALTDDPKSDIRLARKLLVAGRKPGVWVTELRRETLRFLRVAGSRLPRNLRTELVRDIHAGPKLKSMKAETVHQEKVLRLYKLLQAGVKLDKKSKALAEEGRPAEGIPEDRDEFFSWSDGVRFIDPKEFAPANLLVGTVADVVNALSSDTTNFDEFEGLTLQQPVKVISALRRLAEREEWPLKFWERFLWRIETLRHQQKLRGKIEEYVACILRSAPDDLFVEIGFAVAVFVKGIADTYDVHQETSFKALWDKAWKGVSQDVGIGFPDPITEAWGDVAGNLAEAALTRLWKYDPEPDAGLPESVRPYFIVVIANPNGHLGHVILATNLYQLFSIDPEWTQQHLIPLFDQPDQDATRDLWAGYAWSPNVRPNLLSVFKKQFLKVLTTYDTLRSMEENLVNLFVEICLEAPNELTDEEIHGVVRLFSEEALVSSLQALTYRLRGEPAERSRAWGDKVKPWLEKYWPQAAGHNTPQTSEKMLDLLVECGDAFPDAVSWSLLCLKNIGHGLIGLRESGHVEQYPDETLLLLEKIVDEKDLQRWEKNYLRQILDSIENVASQLVGEPKYQRLNKIATSD